MKLVKMPYGESEMKPVGMPYNYNLCLYLKSDELEALGMEDLPKAGETMMMQAMVKVVEASERVEGEEEVEKCVKLAVVEMGLQGSSVMDKAAEAMYERDED